MNTTTRSSHSTNYLKGAILAALGGICWGLSGSMGQFMFNDLGMDSKWLVPIRLGLAGIILLAYACVRDRQFVLQPWKNRADAIELLIYGIFGVSFCQFLYFLTIQLSTAGIGTILQDLSPIMILAVTCIMQRRAPVLREVSAILLALAGVFLITTHGSFTDFAVPPAALLTGVLCAVCVTVYNMVPVRLIKKYPVYLLQGWSFLIGSILIALIFQSWTIEYTPNLMGLFGIAFVVIVGNVLAFTLYMLGVKYIGPDKAILYGFAEPICAAVIGVLFLGSPFTMWDLVGFAAVFGMLALISRK